MRVDLSPKTAPPGGRRQRMRKGMYLLPSLFTIGNIALGFYAILQTLQGSAEFYWHFDLAAIAIGFAAVFDGLDGRIARMTDTATLFGRELDSLADVITFGVAPAVLAWMWGFRFLPVLSEEAVTGTMWRILNPEGTDPVTKLIDLGAIASFLFLIAGASRLARFNVQLNPQPSNPGRPDRKYFVGMPIPAGAAVIASVVHFARGVTITVWWQSLLWAGIILVAGFVMISTWRYYGFKEIDFRKEHRYRTIMLLGVLIAAVRYFSHWTLFVLAITYMFSGVVMRLRYFFRKPASSPPPALKEAT